MNTDNINTMKSTSDDNKSSSEGNNGTSVHIKNGAMIVTSAGGTPLAIIGTIKAAGFTAAGIAKGSSAAALMSKAAVSSGGMIASGSPVAVLQSIGALGLGSPVVVPLAVIGGTTAVTLLYGPKIYNSVKDAANSPVLQENVGKAYNKVTSTASNVAQGLKITFLPYGTSKL